MYGYNAEPPIAIPIYTVLPYCVISLIHCNSLVQMWLCVKYRACVLFALSLREDSDQSRQNGSVMDIVNCHVVAKDRGLTPELKII